MLGYCCARVATPQMWSKCRWVRRMWVGIRWCVAMCWVICWVSWGVRHPGSTMAHWDVVVSVRM